MSDKPCLQLHTAGTAAMFWQKGAAAAQPPAAGAKASIRPTNLITTEQILQASCESSHALILYTPNPWTFETKEAGNLTLGNSSSII